MKNFRKILVLGALFLISGTAFSQNFYKEKVSRNNIISFGVGPSFAYLDNGGPYRDRKFAIRPAASLAYTKKMTARTNLRATLGIQGISSRVNSYSQPIEFWAEHNSAFTAKGTAYYFDVMPTFYLLPFENHMHRSKVNFYAGVGIGVMSVRTEQTFSYNPDEAPSNHQETTGYIPVRAGLSLRIAPYSSIALEGTQLWTFSDTIDGNAGWNKYGDHLFQTQLVFRRFLVPKN